MYGRRHLRLVYPRLFGFVATGVISWLMVESEQEEEGQVHIGAVYGVLFFSIRLYRICITLEDELIFINFDLIVPSVVV